MDYCSALFASQPVYVILRMQSVLNAPARLIDDVYQFDQISVIMCDKLYWLRADERIDFKLCLLVYKAVHGLALDYITEMCLPVGTVEARQRLRSSTAGDLLVPHTYT